MAAGKLVPKFLHGKLDNNALPYKLCPRLCRLAPHGGDWNANFQPIWRT
jgi:hypothetical protein